jgi:hypothetical protein
MVSPTTAPFWGVCVVRITIHSLDGASSQSFWNIPKAGKKNTLKNTKIFHSNFWFFVLIETLFLFPRVET